MFAQNRAGILGASILGTPDAGVPVIRTLTTVGDGTITAEHIAGGFLRRSGPTATFTDTLPTAETLRRMLVGDDASRLSQGNSFIWRYSKNAAYIHSFTRAAGWTIGSNTALGSAATGYRELLVTCANATPAQSYVLSTTNASAVITGLTEDQLKTLSVGMMVEHANFAAGTKINSIDYANKTVTASANASATTANTSVTFSPVFTLEGIFSGSL